MSEDRIVVTCLSCNSSIRAPRAAAGRSGKCPKCGNPVYVPTPADELEEIPLEPEDHAPDDLRRESAALTSDLLREKSAPEDATRPPAQTPAGAGPPARTSAPTINVPAAIVQYLQAIKDSKLDEAATIQGQLARVKAQALSRIQQMMVDAMPPPQLGDLPAPLYLGFLKKLQSELDS